MADARVVVLVRDGCHLCDDALAAVTEICGRLDVGWSMKDVDSDPKLRAAYTDHVPVTMVDGKVLSYWFLEQDALVAALLQPPILGSDHA